MQSSLAEKLSNYKPDASIAKLIKSTPILLLVGPTGAGKDALKERLLSTKKYHHIVSHTTRKPRINHGIAEKDGIDYHFIDKTMALNMLSAHEFVEAKIYSGNLYGTSVAEIKKAHDEHKVAMTDIEVQGVAEYKTLFSGVKAVFLLPPNFSVWQERLSRRYGDVVDASDHKLRLQTALTELEQLLHTDYYVAIVNDKIDNTYDQIAEAMSGKPSLYNDKARLVATKLAQDIQSYLTTL
jgi:guanylate kinase